MSQPTSTPQYHVYYVVWQARDRAGRLVQEGACEVPMTSPITSYDHVAAIAEAIRKQNSVLNGATTRITNWILLRTEPAMPTREPA
jgi:hypothetical protein